MAMPSSTSNSKRALPTGFPWGLALALLVVAAVEVAVRQVPPRYLAPYHIGLQEYAAAAMVARDLPAADVAIIGSSRARNGFAPEVMESILHDAFGEQLIVRNLSCASAQAAENSALTKLLLRHGRPRMVLYGVSPRQLHTRVPPLEQIALFWNFTDWYDYARRVDTFHALTLLPQIIRNWIGEYYYTLRFRYKPTSIAADLFEAATRRQFDRVSLHALLRGDVYPNGMVGARHRMHVTHPDLNLLVSPLVPQRVQRNFAPFLDENGRYPLQDPRVWVGPLAEACHANGVDLVLVDMPVAELLLQAYPPGLQQRYLQTFQDFATEYGVTFVPFSQLGMQTELTDFADTSHMTPSGADRLTRIVTEQIVLPRLESASRQGTSAMETPGDPPAN